MISYEQFLNNLNSINDRIRNACESSGRSFDSVKLLPVTKNHSYEVVEYSKRASFKNVGENRVQEALGKIPLVSDINWELIGHLQTNKVSMAVENFYRIQSVDSVKILDKINEKAKSINKVQKILLQINTAGDDAKFGINIKDAKSICERALSLDNIELEGLMTIGFFDASEDIARKTFVKLRELKEDLEQSFAIKLKELSMGMSGDLEVAIEEAATIIRVGSALFGERIYG